MKKIIYCLVLAMLCLCAQPVSHPFQPVQPGLITFTICYTSMKYEPYGGSGKIYTSETDGTPTKPLNLLMLVHPGECSVLQVVDGQRLCVRFCLPPYTTERTTDYVVAHSEGIYSL